LTERVTYFADVLLPLPLPKHFTYRVPHEMSDMVSKGKRVVVPFGKKKLYTGIITAIKESPPQGYEAKYISDILDDVPLISEKMLEFWEWIARYYMCTEGEVMQAALPTAFKPESQTIITLPAILPDPLPELEDKEYLIYEALQIHETLDLEQISEILQIKNIFPVIRNLLAKEIIAIHEELKEIYKPKLITCVLLHEDYADEVALNALFERLEKKLPQTQLLMAWLVLKQEKQVLVQKSDLLKRAGVNESTLKTMCKNGIFRLEQFQQDRMMPEVETTEHPFKLNKGQEKAYSEIQEYFKKQDTVLIHGVTSSGKTLLYVKLIEEQLAQGKQVLFLLPEIALTSQIILRVKAFFGDQAVAFHSRFSQNERYELWHKIRTGQIKIVIGARSSVFLPLENLGLVIIDEEHESSYKQYEPAPRYHARDTAIVLAKQRGAKIILGSATPSFESYQNALQGRYGLVQLHERYGEVEMPQIITANLAEENRVKTMYGHFTSVLYKAIAKTLEAGEQVILFQNRRGYAPVLECTTCSHVPRCKNCDISLTYHKYNDSLRCHYCGYTISRMKHCMSCGSNTLELKGLGTEKIEDELSVHFPKARVMRLDMDAVRTKNGHREIIEAFEAGEADILVGTQMLSKGLDFGNVTLVGVINADQLMYYPDFRAHERAYQLLTQVSGRAGRKKKQGLVIIQTGQPDHHLIQEVIKQRYSALFANSIEERKEYGYPPFTRLIKLVIKNKDFKLTGEAAFHLQQLLYKRLGAQMVGPEAPPVSRIRNQYIMEILIRIDRDSSYLKSTKEYIRENISATLSDERFKRVYIYADVDPI